MAYRRPITDERLQDLQAEIRPLTDGFDLLADHVVITDADANILYANDAAEKHTGYSRAEMIGKNPGDLWGGFMPAETYEKMWEQIKRFRAPYAGEIENRNKDGYQYWQELRIYPILDDTGEVRFFIGIEPDITVRKAFAMHRAQYTEELERLMKYLEGREVKIRALTDEVAKLKEKLDALRKKPA